MLHLLHLLRLSDLLHLEHLSDLLHLLHQHLLHQWHLQAQSDL
jgi:hypothetical protein